MNEPIRVGLVTPGLGGGGAERWMQMLVQHLPDPSVDISGVLVSNPHATFLQQSIAQPIVRRTKLLTMMPARKQYVPRGEANWLRIKNIGDGWRWLAKQSDVLLVWGIKEMPQTIPPLPPHFIYVSHASGVGRLRSYSPEVAVQVTSAVAVSGPAMRFFDGLNLKVDIIYNGIQPARLKPEVTGNRARWTYFSNIRPADPVFGYLGRLAKEKGADTAVRCAAAAGPNSRLLLMGDGLGHDTGRVHQLCDKMLGGSRYFHAPYASNVGTFFEAIDVFCLPSESEAFSLSLTEAWFAGVPALATRVGAVPELERRYGRLVVPIALDFKPEQLKAAANLALGPEGQEIAARACTLARAEFTAQRMAARWRAYLHDLTRGNR